MDDEDCRVVLDNGSGNIRAGMAGEDFPKSVFPAIVGYDRRGEGQQGGEGKANCYVGDKAQTERHILNIHHPITHGIVTDWCAMEEIWSYVYTDKLHISSSTAPLLVTESSLNPKSNREKMSEVLFEKFGVPSMAVANPGMLAVYSSGRCSAISFESGDGVCQVVPIYEGYTVPDSIQRFDFGGRDMTSHLSSLLTDRGFTFSTPSEMEIVRDMKEKLCYTALDFEQEMIASSSSSSTERSYELPDGSVATVGSERFRVPECMFQPSLHSADAGQEVLAVQNMIYSCLQACDISMRADLCANVLVTGGNTLFPGFGERMSLELKLLLPKKLKIRVITSDKDRAVWIGGSILASLSMFDNVCRTKANYEEFGPSVCDQKCF